MANENVAYTIFKDSHGREKFRGLWDNKGVPTPVEVRLDYGKHKWTDKEIMSLLKGEEVQLDSFETKGGNQMPISGKLGPQSYMGRPYIGFVRTDAEATKRRLPEVGGVEPTQPQAEMEG